MIKIPKRLYQFIVLLGCFALFQSIWESDKLSILDDRIIAVHNKLEPTDLRDDSIKIERLDKSHSFALEDAQVKWKRDSMSGYFKGKAVTNQEIQNRYMQYPDSILKRMLYFRHQKFIDINSSKKLKDEVDVLITRRNSIKF